MKSIVALTHTVSMMMREFIQDKEDYLYRLEKYVSDNKLIVNAHIRIYYSESNGSILSMLLLHELTNEIVVLDDPKGKGLSPEVHTSALEKSLKRRLSDMGWLYNEDLDRVYNELREQLK